MLFFTQAQSDALGDMSKMLDLVLLFMLLFVGVYGLYTAIRLRSTYMLFPNRFLYPNGCTPETCNDEGAFIDFILPRLTVLSVSCLIMGIAYALLIYVFPEAQSTLTDILTLVLPAGVLFWYALLQKKVYKNFW